MASGGLEAAAPIMPFSLEDQLAAGFFIPALLAILVL
jgi:hypothetical protein